MGFSKTWRRLWVSGLLLVSVAAAVEYGRRYWNAQWEAEAGPLIEAVQGLSSLVTLRVTIHDVVMTEISGYTGGVRAALVVSGKVEWGIDFSAARLEQVDPVARTATVVLPHPTVHSVRVDVERTKLAAIGVYGLWRAVPGSEAEQVAIQRAYVGAERAIRSAGGGGEFVGKAEQEAEQTLKAVGRNHGWSLGVRWIDPP